MIRFKNSFTLVEIMIVVGILVVLSALAIQNVLRSRITSHDMIAKTTGLTIAQALELYAAANDGVYPNSITNLTSPDPPYLPGYFDLNLTQAVTPKDGYLFTFAGGAPMSTGYTLTVFPVTCNRTGSKVYTIITGGVVNTTDCM